jgi:hypothetical protein
MAGDDRGRHELYEMLARFQSDLRRLKKPQGIWYLPNFVQGYRRCMRHYVVDSAGVLRRRGTDAVDAMVGALEIGR